MIKAVILSPKVSFSNRYLLVATRISIRSQLAYDFIFKEYALKTSQVSMMLGLKTNIKLRKVIKSYMPDLNV